MREKVKHKKRSGKKCMEILKELRNTAPKRKCKRWTSRAIGWEGELDVE